MFRKINFQISLLILILSFLLALKGFTSPVFAQEAPALIYDTSNHYLGACGLTDKTTWTLENDLEVKLFQVWYNWDIRETEVGFTLKKDNQEFLSGIAVRSECDTYQKNWCNGNLKVEKTFPKGTYELKVDKKKQCAIPAGNGTVRLYGIKTETPVTQPTTATPTVFIPSITPTPSTPPALPIQPVTNQKCSSQWCYPVAGFLVLSNFLTLIFLLRKK